MNFYETLYEYKETTKKEKLDMIATIIRTTRDGKRKRNRKIAMRILTKRGNQR